MFFKKSLLVLPLLLLASCTESEEIILEDLKSIDSSNVILYADIKRDEEVNSLKISTEVSVLNTFNNDSNYTKAYSGSNYQIFKKTTDKAVDLFIYSVNKFDSLTDSYFAYNNIEKIDLSSSSLSNSLLKPTGVVDNNLFILRDTLKEVNFTNFDFASTSDLSSFFYLITTTQALETVDFTGANTSSVIDMSYMFKNSSIKTIKGLDTSNVRTMRYMFTGFKSTTVSLTKGLNTSKVINMEHMFDGAKLTSFDFSSFNTSNVLDVSYMFARSGFTSFNLASFDTSKVINMELMFVEAVAQTLDLSNFNTANTTNMRGMFYSSKFTSLDLSSFNTSKVVYMTRMFADMEVLDTLNIANFTFDSTKTIRDLFLNTGSLIKKDFTLTIDTPINLNLEREPSEEEQKNLPCLPTDKVLDYKNRVIVVTNALENAANGIVSVLKPL